MLAYRFPAAYQNRGAVPAVLERNVLKIGDNSELRLGKLIGSGSYGMVFLDYSGKLVVKFETSPDEGEETIEYLMDVNHWASEFDVGPKFGNWGLLTINQRQLNKMKAMVVENRPRWFDEPNAGPIYYSIYEKWDGDLHDYLFKGKASERFKAIPMPVMERFAARIAKLHSRAVAHLDLAAKNVFVRVKDDIVQDMVLGDYGLSRPRVAWFFEDDPSFHDDMINYYATDFLGKRWAAHMDRVDSFADWLRYEPFNADWCLVGAYALANNWTSMVKRLEKVPPYFNFALPWDAKGWLRVIVRGGGQEMTMDVHGLMSLFHLRENLKLAGQLPTGILQFEANWGVVPIKNEKKHYPSDVIQEIDNDFIIVLKLRRGARASFAE